MDLIYMNAEREDVGVLPDYDFDLAFGVDENDFECKVAATAHCCAAGYYLYIENTEYGGIIDAIANDTASKEVTYSGRTWQGMLNSKVLAPDSGQAYLVVSGEANTVIASLLARMGLDDLFEAASEDSGITISAYQMNRYIGGYDGIIKMLKSVNAKLRFTFQGGKVILSAVPRYDWSRDEEFDSDLVDFQAKKNLRSVNHLICLGSGELQDRTVIHLYADGQGNISQTPTFTGLDEYAAVYDYPNAESADDLMAGGLDKLKELWEPDALTIDFTGDSDSYDIGDVVGARDNVTGLSVCAEIAKKIVKVNNGQITISYEVGE